MMSSLIAALDATQVIVATDTLYCSMVPGNNSHFGTKAYLLPHMNLLLAGSGVSGFGEAWLSYLNTERAYRGIEALETDSGERLQYLWEKWNIDNPRPRGCPSDQVVYHFGVSENTGEMLGFVHHSWDGFRPEELSFRTRGEPVIVSRPQCSPPDVSGMSSFADLTKAFFPMMQEQRAKQAANFYDEGTGGKVTIGGELVPVVQWLYRYPAFCTLSRMTITRTTTMPFRLDFTETVLMITQEA